MSDQIEKYKPKIVFIIGHPRSGTTWLMWLLAQHPDVAACNHAGFFHALEPLRTWWKAGSPFGKTIHVFKRTDPDEVEGQYQQVKLNHLLKLPEFDELIRPLTETTFQRILAAKPGTRVAVEQTPENLLFTEMICSILPEAYFLHIIRDPRAVAASMRQAVRDWADPTDFPNHPVQIAESWNRYMDLGHRLGEESPTYKTIRYEDLRSRGSETLDQIFRWIGLESSPAACSRFLEASSIDRMREKENLMPEGFFRRGRSQGWREDLSADHIRTVETVTSKWMSEWGYEKLYAGSDRKPRTIRLYELQSGFRKISGGGMLPMLRRVFGGNRLSRSLARRIRALRRTLQGN